MNWLRPSRCEICEGALLVVCSELPAPFGGSRRVCNSTGEKDPASPGRAIRFARARKEGAPQHSTARTS